MTLKRKYPTITSGTDQCLCSLVRLNMCMDLQVTDTSQFCTLVRPTMRSCFPLHPLVLSKILNQDIKSSLVASRRNYRQPNTSMSGPLIKIISHRLMLQAARTKILLLRVNVVCSPPCMFGTLNSCNPSLISSSDPPPKVSQHSQLVAVPDTWQSPI